MKKGADSHDWLFLVTGGPHIKVPFFFSSCLVLFIVFFSFLLLFSRWRCLFVAYWIRSCRVHLQAVLVIHHHLTQTRMHHHHHHQEATAIIHQVILIHSHHRNLLLLLLQHMNHLHINHQLNHHQAIHHLLQLLHLHHHHPTITTTIVVNHKMYVLKRQLIREMGQGMSDVCGKKCFGRGYAWEERGKCVIGIGMLINLYQFPCVCHVIL